MFWSWLMFLFSLALASASPLWQLLDHTWRARHEATVWMHRLRSARVLAMVSGRSVVIAPVRSQSLWVWSMPLCARMTGDAHSACWPSMRHCVASTWPDQKLQWDPSGLAHGQQGRWFFGTHRSCCWQVVLSHAGRLRLTFQRDTLNSIVH